MGCTLLSLPHWQYFLALESDLLRCARFVEFNKENFQTYSLEFARVIVLAVSEIDTVAKLLCREIDRSARPDSIGAYRPAILHRYPRFLEYPINIPRAELTLTPWADWTSEKPPAWWTAANKLKHKRDTHFGRANLENALNSCAALMATITYYYDAVYGAVPEIEPSSAPRLYEPDDISTASHMSISWSCDVWR